MRLPGAESVREALTVGEREERSEDVEFAEDEYDAEVVAQSVMLADVVALRLGEAEGEGGAEKEPLRVGEREAVPEAERAGEGVGLSDGPAEAEASKEGVGAGEKEDESVGDALVALALQVGDAEKLALDVAGKE